MGDKRDRDDDDRPGNSGSGHDTTPIIVGNVIQLKSGGPALVATRVSADSIDAIGFSLDGVPISVSWPLLAFRKLRP